MVGVQLGVSEGIEREMERLGEKKMGRRRGKTVFSLQTACDESVG